MVMLKEPAWGRRAQNTPWLLPFLVPQKGRFSLMREVLTKQMSKKVRDKNERQRDLIEDKGSEKKKPSHQEITKKASEGRARVGVGGLTLASVVWAWKYTRKGLTLEEMRRKEHREALLSHNRSTARGRGEPRFRPGAQSPFLPSCSTPLSSGEMGGGQEVRFQSPLALGGRTAVLRSCWGFVGGRGAAADLI